MPNVLFGIVERTSQIIKTHHDCQAGSRDCAGGPPNAKDPDIGFLSMKYEHVVRNATLCETMLLCVENKYFVRNAVVYYQNACQMLG